MDTAAQQLHRLFERLDAAGRATLLAFAEFLVARGADAVAPAQPVRRTVTQPERIERPAGESVVAGLKRLARTYPMLDKSEMLSATSDIVATHLMKGTDPAMIIDELETVFRTHYEQLLAANRDD